MTRARGQHPQWGPAGHTLLGAALDRERPGLRRAAGPVPSPSPWAAWMVTSPASFVVMRCPALSLENTTLPSWSTILTRAKPDIPMMLTGCSPARNLLTLSKQGDSGRVSLLTTTSSG